MRYIKIRKTRFLAVVSGVAALLMVGVTPSFAVEFEAPANDDIAAATAISSTPFAENVDVTEATVATTDGWCRADRTVWFEFTPTKSERVEVSTQGSAMDTVLAVYRGAPDDLTQIGCNDDSGTSKGSAVRFEAVAGTTYHFMASGRSAGNLHLSLNEAPEPVELGLSFDTQTWVNSASGKAVITGTLECSAVAQGVRIELHVTQPDEPHNNSGDGYSRVNCVEGEVRWLVNIEYGEFEAGSAGIDGTAYYELDQTEVDRSDGTNLVSCSRIGTLEDDTLLGTSKNDKMCGLDGDDTMQGRGGNDVLRGAGGDDEIFGAGGNDILYGGDGLDRLFGANGNDKLRGNERNDYLHGGSGKDRCNGGGGQNRMVSC